MPIFEGNRGLLDAFRRGERHALEEVYYRYVEEVDVLVRRGFITESAGHLFVPGVGDAQLERDLVQEVFARAFGEAARAAYDGLRPYRPYLLRIAKNLLVDRLRARSRDPVAAAVPDDGELALDDLIEKNSPLPEPPAEPDLDFRRLSDLTRRFVDRQDPELRELVRLRFSEDLSQDDVAARMGITRRRVRTVEDNLYKQLKRFLRREKALDP
jgi:RNA polymerase sigma-70 factor (ECF subfamily)